MDRLRYLLLGPEFWKLVRSVNSDLDLRRSADAERSQRRQLGAAMIGIGLNWWYVIVPRRTLGQFADLCPLLYIRQAIVTIFLSQTISSIAMLFNSRCASVYHIGYPVRDLLPHRRRLRHPTDHTPAGCWAKCLRNDWRVLLWYVARQRGRFG